MDTLVAQIVNVVTQSPGNLVYHLTIAFSIGAALQAVLSHRAGQHPEANRLALGLGVLLLAQLTSFAASLLAWQGLVDGRWLLPPLDRAVPALSLIWIIWLWSFHRPARPANLLLAFLSLGLVILFVFNLIAWGSEEFALAFNATWSDWSWQFFSIFTAAAGILLILINRPPNWGVGLAFLVINLIGHAVHLIWADPGGNLPAFSRLAQFVTYPLLPILAQRLKPASIPTEEVTPPVEQPIEPLLLPAAAPARDKRAWYVWLQVAAQDEPGKIYPKIARAIAQTMSADYCFLISGSDTPQEFIVQAGYDLQREEGIDKFILEPGSLPTLASAYEQSIPHKMDARGENATELRATATAFRLTAADSLLFIPLTADSGAWGGLVLFSTSPERIWDSEDQIELMAVTEMLVQILQRAEQRLKYLLESAQLRSELANTKNRLVELEQQNRDMQVALEQAKQDQSTKTELDSLIVLQKESQEMIHKLQAENVHLRALLKDQDIDNDLKLREEIRQLEEELRLALEEIAHLQALLDETKVLQTVLPETNKELATPKDWQSSVDDLIQKTKAEQSIEETLPQETLSSPGDWQSLVDELVQKASLEQTSETPVGEIQPSLEPADIIDQAIIQTSALLREKNIALRVDLPDSIPAIQFDRDAVEQIVSGLLKSASQASPFEGTISLRLSLEAQDNLPSLVLQVTRSHNGKAALIPEALPGQPVPIEALEEDLKALERLASGQGGQLWQENGPEEGASTVYVRIPVQITASQNGSSPL